jgi:phage I-like protein
MLGHYAPVVKSVGLSAENEVLSAKFEAMTDEQLLAIAEGRAGA